MTIYRLPDNNCLSDELKDTLVIKVRDLKKAISKLKFKDADVYNEAVVICELYKELGL
jgi:hypothetical protein